jgi:hypothetical protein
MAASRPGTPAVAVVHLEDGGGRIYEDGTSGVFDGGATSSYMRGNFFLHLLLTQWWCAASLEARRPPPLPPSSHGASWWW